MSEKHWSWSPRACEVLWCRAVNMLAPMNANLYTNNVTAIHGAAEVVAKASMKSAAEETKQFYEPEEDGLYDIGYWYYCGRDLETKGDIHLPTGSLLACR